ncbi:MAG: DUF4270 domain-containing protein [Muribaculaceae bacterium]|nr:DUF4270 domain-containing protein [Muribaculaceae bacterium]
MNRIYFLLAIIAAAILPQSCGDTSNIGTSLVQDEISIVMDSSWVATGVPMENTKLASKTTTQLLGIIEAGEYGKFSSDYVTQFMPAGKITTNRVPVENIDSCYLVLSVPEGAYVGDSLVPMGLEVYPLTRQLPSPVYSDFDPAGYYDENDKLASYIYTGSNMNAPDSLKGYGYVFHFIPMPRELGQRLYKGYLENPAMYLTPQSFAQFFPGIYVKNSFGSGRVIKIAQSLLRLHYHIDSVSATTGRDTLYRYTGNYYATTPEIVTNNNISYEMSPTLAGEINRGRNIISGPAGTDVQINFPAKQMLDSYREKAAGKLAVVNTLSMSIPTTDIENNYGIKAPENVLLVLKSKKQKFFADNQLNDNVTSFLGTYNAPTKAYIFSDMRGYFLDLLKKDVVTEEDYEFCLTPVTLVTTTEESTSYYYYSQSTTTTVGVSPYVEQPAMTELDINKAKIILTYSLQSIKN